MFLGWPAEGEGAGRSGGREIVPNGIVRELPFPGSNILFDLAPPLPERPRDIGVRAISGSNILFEIVANLIC